MDNIRVIDCLVILIMFIAIYFGKKFLQNKSDVKNKKLFYSFLIIYFIFSSYVRVRFSIINTFILLPASAYFTIKSIYLLLKKQPFSAYLGKGFICICLFVIGVLISPLEKVGTNSINTSDKQTTTVTKIKQSYESQKISEITGMSPAAANNLEKLFNECEIENPSIKHDEMLDEYKDNPETKGYRIKENNLSNIILYITGNEVTAIRYADFDMYANNKLNYKTSDFYMKSSEMTKYQLFCQDTMKQLLVSPATADFAGFSDWKYYKTPKEIIVSSFVDSQNQFGAIIRTNFKFTFSPDGKTVTDVIINGQHFNL